MNKPLEATELDKSEAQSAPKQWGQLLREAREQRNISLDDIAMELRLDIKLLEDIESERLDQLPSAPFVKGYMRSYARLLDISPDPITDAFSQVCGPVEPGLTQVGYVKETTSTDKGPRYATWGVVAVVAVSFFIWWRAELLSNGDGVEVDTVSFEEQPETNMPIEMAMLEMHEVEQVALPEVKQVLPPATEVASETPREVVVVEAQPQVDVEPVIVGDKQTITMRFKEDSWVEVYDATGERLFLDIGKAGSDKTVAGYAPFKMLFGHAPGVEMEYNGQPYDHMIYNRKGVAKFTLGEE